MSKRPVHVTCVRCAGKGSIDNIVACRCRLCLGKGWIKGFLVAERACPNCDGEGERMLNMLEDCHICDGRGYIIEMRPEADIPVAAGVGAQAGKASASPFGAACPTDLKAS